MKKVLFVICLMAILVPWTSALGAGDSSQYLSGVWSYCGDSADCYVRVKIVNPNVVPVAIDVAFFDNQENFCGCLIYPYVSPFQELEFPFYEIYYSFYENYSFYGGPLVWGGGEYAQKCVGISGMMTAMSYKPCSTKGAPELCETASIASFNNPISGFATYHDGYRSSIAGMGAINITNLSPVLSQVHNQCYDYIEQSIQVE